MENESKQQILQLFAEQYNQAIKDNPTLVSPNADPWDGPKPIAKDGFAITGYTETWDQLLVNDVKLEAAKAYIYLKVKTVFDPPSSSFVQTSYENLILQLEWRLIAQAESVEEFDFIKNTSNEAVSET